MPKPGKDILQKLTCQLPVAQIICKILFASTITVKFSNKRKLVPYGQFDLVLLVSEGRLEGLLTFHFTHSQFGSLRSSARYLESSIYLAEDSEEKRSRDWIRHQLDQI